MRKTLVDPKEFTQSGFTSPGEEDAIPAENLDKNLKRDPEATYPARMGGKAMEKAGIPDGAYLLFDRGIIPKKGQVVYAWHDGEKVIRFYEKLKDGRIKLYPASDDYPTYYVDSEFIDSSFIGVVTWSMKCLAPPYFPNVKRW